MPVLLPSNKLPKLRCQDAQADLLDYILMDLLDWMVMDFLDMDLLDLLDSLK